MDTKYEFKTINVKTDVQIKAQTKAVNGVGTTGPWSEEATIIVSDWSSKLKLKTTNCCWGVLTRFGDSRVNTFCR